MFEKLLAERQARPGAVEQLFTDHPLEEDRVQNTQAQISQINPAIIRTLTNDSRAFQDFKARVRALPAPVAQRARRGSLAARRSTTPDTRRTNASAARAVVSSTSACVSGADRESGARGS